MMMLRVQRVPLRPLARLFSSSKVSTSPQTQRIGWIGTGVMGKSMCGHLISAGYPVTVYTRTPEKASELVARGATLVETPRDVAKQSDVVFSMVGYPSDVEEIVFGKKGVLQALNPGSIFCDFTTSRPALAQKIYDFCRKIGVRSLDAPVSGGDIGARDAKLSIMVGGEKSTLEAVQPLLALLGTNIKYMGPAGAGQHTKMVNQILIASNMVGMVEGLLYAKKAGLDLNQVIAAVGSGAAGSWSINNLGPRIVQGNFDPGFFVEHFIKDLGIALEEAKRMDLDLKGLHLARQLYEEVKAQGYSKLGTHALYLAVENLHYKTRI
eukprot:GILJ01005217.1.p1 GENE.GILJ01005217.1~~GILJ01005217.1.p1  ORF type:complete len:341 (-),score=48.36 GILJ01005217.1:277-1245(-)